MSIVNRVFLFILRGHPQDVYDIAWSPTSEFLLSGSIDHMAMVWDLSGTHRTFTHYDCLVRVFIFSSRFVPTSRF